MRYTASIPSVKSTRLRSSPTWKMLRRLSIIPSSGSASTDYRTSVEPPAAAIFSAALPLNLCALIVSAFATSPRASTFTFSALRATRPFSCSSSGVMTVPASKTSAIRSTFTTANSMRKMFVKPRFGTRRCSGIWPPSKPRLNLRPERDCAPLCPRPAVLPLPEPWPRPTRKARLFLEPSAGFRSCRPNALSFFSMTLSFDRDQVPHLQDRAAHFGRVLQRHRVADLPEAQALDDLGLVLVEANRALHEGDFQ